MCIVFIFLISTIGDAMVEQQIRTQRKKISDINAQIHRIQEQIETMQRAKDNKTNELRYLQNNLSQLEGAKNARLNLLARIDKGAHTGVQWLYRNKNMFRSVVYGPMLLEVCSVGGVSGLDHEFAILVYNYVFFLTDKCSRSIKRNIPRKHDITKRQSCFYVHFERRCATSRSGTANKAKVARQHIVFTAPQQRRISTSNSDRTVAALRIFFIFEFAVYRTRTNRELFV